MKISIIGAGNVGALSALRIAQEAYAEVLLVDIAKGLALGKSLDMEDAQNILKLDYSVKGSEDISSIKGSDIVVLTAGLVRKPGMTREDLLSKNAAIVKEVALNVKKLSPQAVLIIVTNPLDLMTYLALKSTGFNPRKVFGMGITLDGSRFANLISEELKVPVSNIEPCVIGIHGEGMLPLARLTKVNSVCLNELMDDHRVRELVKRTVLRGAEIVSLLGSGSAYFAPSAAVAEVVRSVARDEKRILGISAYLSGEYAVNDICIGVPARIGKSGIEQIITLDLNEQERKQFCDCARTLRDSLCSMTL
jgi:malate dehydrogenase